MRATLHDELMREAGFETDHGRELARRRATTRRIARGVGAFAIALGTFSGLLSHSDHGHGGVGLFLLVLTAIGLVCAVVLERLDRREKSGDEESAGRRNLRERLFS